MNQTQRSRLTKLADALETEVSTREYRATEGYRPVNLCPRIFSRAGWKLNRKNQPAYNKRTNLDAARDFFGLSREEATVLFDSSTYRRDHSGRKSVANRIRSFLNGNTLERKIESIRQNGVDGRA